MSKCINENQDCMGEVEPRMQFMFGPRPLPQCEFHAEDKKFSPPRVSHEAPEPGKYNYIYIYDDGSIDIMHKKFDNREGVKWLHAHTVLKAIPGRPEIEVLKQKKFRKPVNTEW